MKRKISWLLAIFLVAASFGLCACGSSSNAESQQTQTESSAEDTNDGSEAKAETEVKVDSNKEADQTEEEADKPESEQSDAPLGNYKTVQIGCALIEVPENAFVPPEDAPIRQQNESSIPFMLGSAQGNISSYSSPDRSEYAEQEEGYYNQYISNPDFDVLSSDWADDGNCIKASIKYIANYDGIERIYWYKSIWAGGEKAEYGANLDTSAADKYEQKMDAIAQSFRNTNE